ncbi:hypothetical protein KXV85_005802, partial [Aspergillus fumigatus]
DRLHLRDHRPTQRRRAASGGAVLERRHEPAHAQHDLRRSCADGPSLLSCRRPQHPDDARAPARRHCHDPRPLHAGHGPHHDRTRATDPDGPGSGHHPGGQRSSRLGDDRPVIPASRRHRFNHRAAPSCRSIRRSRRA